MLRSVFRIGAVALTILVSTSRVSADTMFPAAGGRGDMSFNDRCPAGQNLIGLAGRNGLFTDQIQIICAPMLANGIQGTKYFGPLRGGGGGTPAESTCARDSVVSGANLAMTKNNAHVAWVTLYCVSVVSNSTSKVLFGQIAYDPQGAGSGLAGSGYVEQVCGNGELANGFNGRSGKDVNALGLDCIDRLQFTAQNTQAPAAPVKPIKTTGTAILPCPQGYVWRVASPTDRVCVTPAQRARAAAQNAAAASHLSQTDTTYGPNTCASGYVWREAFAGDVVCVTPAERDEAKKENAQAPQPVSH